MEEQDPSVIVSTFVLSIPGFVIFHLVISFFRLSKHLARTSFSLSPGRIDIRARMRGFELRPLLSRDYRRKRGTTESISLTQTFRDRRRRRRRRRQSVAHPTTLPSPSSPSPPPSPLSPPLQGRPSMRPHRIRVRTTERLIVRFHRGTCSRSLTHRNKPANNLNNHGDKDREINF